ncbi:MAG: prepilin-type N-terminal cleavage/methylation domain-containing protein [bacterium]|nr:prepilin-type N-terminal cleavage/methylation domain-containing protein [bacterium]
MKRAGFTLLEVMVSAAIMTIALGIMFGLARNLAQSAQVQDTKVVTADEARTAMMFLAKEVRQAAVTSINWTDLPGPVLTYQVATDRDGNGYAVDMSGNLELSVPRTVGRDSEDVNDDGQTANQLVRTAGTTFLVISNGVLIDEDANDNGGVDLGEDANLNGVLDRGLWFERAGDGVRITIQTQHRSSVDGPLITSTLIETVMPRN